MQRGLQKPPAAHVRRNVTNAVIRHATGETPRSRGDSFRLKLDAVVISAMDGTAHWLLRHWLLAINLLAGLTLVGAVLVAYLRSVEAFWISEPLAGAYRLICPQRPDHSYFLWGAQMGMEQRMVALFAAQLLAGLAFGLVRRRMRPLQVRFLLASALPMAVDVGSQMVGLRDSDWGMRTVTGGLAAVAVVAWAYPYVERAARIVRWQWYEAPATVRTPPVTEKVSGLTDTAAAMK